MSTAPTEAHYAQADAFLESCGFNPNEHFMRGRRTRLAQLLADSEARAVEAETALLRQLYASEKQAKIERGDMFCECQDALTASRERVRVLREAAEIMLVPHIENSEGGTPSGTYAMTFRYEQLAAALAFTSEHAKEGA